MTKVQGIQPASAQSTSTQPTRVQPTRVQPPSEQPTGVQPPSEQPPSELESHLHLCCSQLSGLSRTQLPLSDDNQERLEDSFVVCVWACPPATVLSLLCALGCGVELPDGLVFCPPTQVVCSSLLDSCKHGRRS